MAVSCLVNLCVEPYRLRPPNHLRITLVDATLVTILLNACGLLADDLMTSPDSFGLQRPLARLPWRTLRLSAVALSFAPTFKNQSARIQHLQAFEERARLLRDGSSAVLRHTV